MKEERNADRTHKETPLPVEGRFENQHMCILLVFSNLFHCDLDHKSQLIS